MVTDVTICCLAPPPFRMVALGSLHRLITSVSFYIHDMHPIRTVYLRYNFGSVFYFHLRFLTVEMLEVSSLVFTVGRRTEIALHPEGKCWTLRPFKTSCRLAGFKSVSVTPHGIFLSSVSPFPSLFHPLQLPASTLQLPSCFVLFSSPPPQRWLPLSSTGSNRHQITINPASLDLPIVILLGG